MEQAHFRPVTYRELRRYPDDGMRRELIDGVVIEMPSPAVDHQTVVVRLMVLIGNFVLGRDLGFVFPAPIDVYFTPRHVLEPDLVFVSRANRGIVRRLNLHGPPDLCIEVLSPGAIHLDRITKRALYARFGVAEYWIVDPVTQTIEMLGLPDPLPRQQRLRVYSPLEGSRVLRGLEIDQAAIFVPAFPRA